MPIPTPSSGPLFTGQIRPPDVPVYVPREIAFATGNNPPVWGDGSSTGGFAPYWLQQRADIPTTPRTGWFNPGIGEVAFEEKLCIGYGGTETEAKFRTFAEFSPIVAPVDPVRYYGLPGASHLHMFWGNSTPSAFMTSVTARNLIGDDDGSGAAGGRLNSTGYWMPALLFDKDGVTYAITPGYTIIYYNTPPSSSIRVHPNVNGMRYVSGVDMDTPDRLFDIINQANTDAGYARYNFQNAGALGSQPYYAKPWFHRWSIEGTPGTGNERYLINPDGSNPFLNVGAVANGAALLQLEFGQELAWDGVNPWSPRGYDHVMPMIFDSLTGTNVPPLGWYELPVPQYNMAWNLVELEAFLGGPYYNYNPRLSSDAHLNMLGWPGKGHSVHADWLDGWDGTSRLSWETHGTGCGVLGGIPHEMDDSEIGPNEVLITSHPSPDGKLKQVDTSRPIQIHRIPADPTAVTVASPPA